MARNYCTYIPVFPPHSHPRCFFQYFNFILIENLADFFLYNNAMFLVPKSRSPSLDYSMLLQHTLCYTCTCTTAASVCTDPKSSSLVTECVGSVHVLKHFFATSYFVFLRNFVHFFLSNANFNFAPSFTGNYWLNNFFCWKGTVLIFRARTRRILRQPTLRLLCAGCDRRERHAHRAEPALALSPIPRQRSSRSPQPPNTKQSQV